MLRSWSKKLRNLLIVRDYRFLLATMVLFWLKTCIVYIVVMQLSIESILQAVILLFNPLSSIVLCFGIALFFKRRRQWMAILIIDMILSFILFANMLYERFFNDFITIPVLFQSNNFGQLGDSIHAIFHPADLLLFADIAVLLGVALCRKATVIPTNKMIRRRTFLIGAILLLLNLGLAEIERPQLLMRTFDRKLFVKLMGAYNYHIYDLIQHTRSSAQRAMADSNDLTDVYNYVQSQQTEPNPKYFGAAKGMNVIFVSMESLQTFMVKEKVDGQKVMPFLSSLTHDKNTLYFNQIYHQTGQGKTSDAEFIIENGLFGLPRGAVFTQKAQNTYQATPKILGERGYTSAVFHGNHGSFWNRDRMYDALGFDFFFDSKAYNTNMNNTIGYGLKDIPFFKQSLPILKGINQPFYTKLITLSNHHPYKIDKRDVMIPPEDTDDKIVNHYFQTARYMDQALENFFEQLRDSGLLKRSVIVLYGDHYGISDNHQEAMSEVLGKKVTPYVQTKLQQIPLFIRVPGVEGKVIDKVGGQIDIRSTLLHLLGMHTNQYISFSSDLLSKDKKSLTVLRNGRFITQNYLYTDDTCYDKTTGEPTEMKQCRPFKKQASQILSLSDKVVYGDLLRFYQPGQTSFNQK
ncbi:LTA synthase family protein [Tuberibacillus sp. Marseille-P3662]|uniref:LTA synthase family protein n=1 Tax=Tuberibacillus sp. Marseille-P3662 TaxID=1965358 RepID=UPI00111C34C8|nr:LTA synthase family protein [Tuberibacillus sp. Marseille-P3662]